MINTIKKKKKYFFDEYAKVCKNLLSYLYNSLVLYLHSDNYNKMLFFNGYAKVCKHLSS